MDANDSEVDEIPNKKLKRMVVRMNNNIKEGMNKHLNKFKDNTDKQLNEIKKYHTGDEKGIQ
jgi:hypothetical protein